MDGAVSPCPVFSAASTGASNVINACLMIAAVGIGFGGSPWAAFAICGSLVVGFGVPAHLDRLKRYAGQPKADIVLVIIFEIGLTIAGTLASAWMGYALRYALARALRS